MCKHHLRTMNKPQVLRIIAGWEIGFWIIICGWIVISYIKRDQEKIFISYVEEFGFGTVQQRDQVQLHTIEELENWESGLWAHSVTCFLFTPIAVILFIGVQRKSRCIIVAWMLSVVAVSITRVWAISAFPKAYGWVKWFEIYWIFRLYFFLVAGQYCIDLWNEADTAEILSQPVLIPTDDPRQFRGMHGYPDYPLTLDQRPRIYGTGRHVPMHLDWRFVNSAYPEWFASEDETGRAVLQIDKPPHYPS